MHVYDVDIATAKLTKRGRITCMLLRNKTRWRLTFHQQVKYQRLNANTYIVAAILFSGHPYIGGTTVPTNIYYHWMTFTITMNTMYVNFVMNIVANKASMAAN